MSSPDEYDSTPQRGSGPVYSRVYRRGGRSAHLMLEDGSARIICGKYNAFPCCLDKFCCCGQFPARMKIDYQALDVDRCQCPHETRYSRDTWLGTGSQQEADHAAKMPLCTGCFASREAQLDDPRLGTGHNVEMT